MEKKGSKVTYRLNGNFIAILPDAKKSQVDKIVLPDIAQSIPDTGTVVGVGPGKLNKKGVLVPPPVEVGDRVVFHKYLDVGELEIEGKDILVMDFAHLIAALE